MTAIETYKIWAYWMVRTESPEECAERALTLLGSLEHLDVRFTGFKRAGRAGGKRGRVPLELEKPALAAIFARGVNRDDVNRAPIKELGFTVWASSGGKGCPGATLQMHCGCYTDAVANSCILYWDKVDADPLMEVPMMRKVIGCVVDAWDPDWLISGSWQHREAVNVDKSLGEWPVGWWNYISVRQGRVPPLPAPVQIERIGDKGTMVLLTPERITVSNPEHVELGRRVRELLGRSGVLTKRKEGPGEESPPT